jgi:hypothetical protein
MGDFVDEHPIVEGVPMSMPFDIGRSFPFSIGHLVAKTVAVDCLP